LDKPSFIELYDRYFDGVNRYLRYRVDDPWDADDLTATVFLKAWENFSKFRGEAPFAVWIFRIAHNAYVDYLRQKKQKPRQEELSPHISCEKMGPEELLLLSEEIQELRAMLQCLSPEQKDVISLRYAAELTFPEIAQILGKTTAAVKMIHYRALKILRERFYKREEVRRSGP